MVALAFGGDNSIEAKPRKMLRRKTLPQAKPFAQVHHIVWGLIEKLEDF